MMDNAQKDMLARLAKAVAAEFGSGCEVVVHELTGPDAEHTVIAIENGHVSGRRPGDGPSRVALEAMKHPEAAEDMYSYHTRTRDGRELKSSTVYIRDENGAIDGIFAINFDVTPLIMASRTLAELGQAPSGRDEATGITGNVNDLLDELIRQAAAISGKPVAMMTKDDKIRAIHFLNDAGAFLITHSGDKVAEYFRISKYTLYTYLDSKPNGEIN